MIDISFKVKRQGGRRRLISFPIYSFILFFSFFLLFFLYCSFIMSKIADTATNKLDWFFILVATWISSQLILVVHFCASTLHYLFWYILIQKRRKQNSFFIEHLWWVLLKMSVNRAVGSFFIFYSSPPQKTKFGPKCKWFKISFCNSFFENNISDIYNFFIFVQTFQWTSSGFFMISDFLTESLKATKN